MFKVIYLLTRRDGMDEASFVAHWKDVHAPLVSRIPGVLGYTIGPVTGPSGADRPDFDGVGEVWYADRGAYLAAAASPEMADALRRWPSFISHVVTAFVDELVVIDRTDRARP
jgi:uncharacterized protein (TIGR02118 family)